MARKLNGIELTRYDDLFKTDAERETDHQERVQIVSAEQVFPYARQPYSVDRPSADLVRLMDSIERTGIAEPLIVRPRSEGGYEIISGHRRDYCAKVVGLDTRPVIVRDYSDEDADILVVDYNINRENLLPSEKAKAYKLKLDAMKRQGARIDLTSCQVGAVDKVSLCSALPTKKDAHRRHPACFIIRFRFNAVADKRQWSSAASKLRRKTRTKLCSRFCAENEPSHQTCRSFSASR